MSGAERAPFDRQQPPRGPAGSVLSSREAKAWEDAFKFLDEAQKQLAEERKQAQEAASRLYAAERTRGYEEGKARGALEATRLLTETTVRADRYLQSIEQQVAELAMGIVRRVLGDLDVRNLVAVAAAQAVVDLRREKSLTVTVHPEAVERVRAALADISLASLVGRVDVTVEADPTFDRTACVVASNFAVVDASIETQLTAIAAAIGAVRGDGAS